MIEAAIGYPARLFAWIGHPVTWIGALIGWLDRSLNRETMSFAMRRMAGVVALLILLVVSRLIAAWSRARAAP